MRTQQVTLLAVCYALAISNYVTASENLLIIDLMPTGINQTPWEQSSLGVIGPVLRMHVHGTDTNASPNVVRFEEGAFNADFGVSVLGGTWRDVVQTEQGVGFEFDLSTLSAPQSERLVNADGNDLILSGSVFSAFDRSQNNAFIQGSIAGASTRILAGGTTSLTIDLAPTGINQAPWGQSSLSTVEPMVRMHVRGTDTETDPDVVRFEEGAFSADFSVDFAHAAWLDVMETQAGTGFEFDVSSVTAPQLERLVSANGNDVIFSGSGFSAFDRTLSNAFIQGTIIGVHYIPEPASAALLAAGATAVGACRRRREAGAFY